MEEKIEIGRHPMKAWQFCTLVVVALVVLWLIPKSQAQVEAQEPSRFEILQGYKQPGGLISKVETWHDAESGVEFICVYPWTTNGSAEKVSCFTTGRSWHN